MFSPAWCRPAPTSPEINLPPTLSIVTGIADKMLLESDYLSYNMMWIVNAYRPIYSYHTINIQDNKTEWNNYSWGRQIDVCLKCIHKKKTKSIASDLPLQNKLDTQDCNIVLLYCTTIHHQWFWWQSFEQSNKGSGCSHLRPGIGYKVKKRAQDLRINGGPGWNKGELQTPCNGSYLFFMQHIRFRLLDSTIVKR